MVIALVLSGGTGSRLGADIPKQYLRVQGRPVLLYCMETLHKSPVIDAVQIVAAQEWQEEILSLIHIYILLNLVKNTDYAVCGIVDSDADKWGQNFNGITIESPDVDVYKRQEHDRKQ